MKKGGEMYGKEQKRPQKTKFNIGMQPVLEEYSLDHFKIKKEGRETSDSALDKPINPDYSPILEYKLSNSLAPSQSDSPEKIDSS